MHALIAPLISLDHVKMVKISSVVFELKWGRKWKLCCNSAEIGRYSFFGILAFWNGLEYHNFDFSRLIGNHFCIAGKNLVRFGIVTPEFEAKEVVQHYSWSR